MAMLGHELRNVLNGILGVAELLANSSLDREQQHLVNALQHSGRQLHWLIGSVGCAGQATEFPFRPRLDRLNGVDLLEQIVRCQTPAADFKNNILVLSIEPGLPAWWHTDARLMRLLVDNLLGNAIKFTRSGLVEIEVRQEKCDRSDGSGLELLVRDSGPGISLADSVRIFKPWVQLENDRENEGSGLGLHICRRIVSALSGELDYRFESGAGSCFHISLPHVLEPYPWRDPVQACGLFSTMSCLLLLDGGLRYSIETLLGRLGIPTRSCGEKKVAESNRDIELQISFPQISPRDPGMRPHLKITHQSLAGSDTPTLRSRWLQTPVLESTLGPLLMEMALEWRLSLQTARTFDSDEKPD